VHVFTDSPESLDIICLTSHADSKDGDLVPAGERPDEVIGAYADQRRDIGQGEENPHDASPITF